MHFWQRSLINICTVIFLHPKARPLGWHWELTHDKLEQVLGRGYSPAFLSPFSSVCGGRFPSAPADGYVLLHFLGCRTRILQDIRLLLTAPTWAAPPVPSLLTRPRASPWRALTTWVGTHDLLWHSDLTSQQLLVPHDAPLALAVITPPFPSKDKLRERERDFICLRRHKQYNLTSPFPVFQDTVKEEKTLVPGRGGMDIQEILVSSHYYLYYFIGSQLFPLWWAYLISPATTHSNVDVPKQSVWESQDRFCFLSHTRTVSHYIFTKVKKRVAQQHPSVSGRRWPWRAHSARIQQATLFECQSDCCQQILIDIKRCIFYYSTEFK